jgi:4-amino-4-deoxy-L-arabinose transferase-like glycosyltransferase
VIAVPRLSSRNGVSIATDIERIPSSSVKAWLAAHSLVLAFVLIFMVGTVGRALSRPFWHDELFTFYIATRTTVAGLWEVLARGTDLNPPLYYLAVRASSTLLGAGALATRLPALLGFVAASIALYIFVRRRLGGHFAIVAALIPSLTGYYMYAYEGRSYALVLGFSGVALAAWQRRDESTSHRVAPLVCGLMVAAAAFTHYYAVLIVLPLAAGELTRTIMRRRVDWAMSIALTFAIIPFLFLRPLVETARQFAPTFWSRPSPGDLVESYRQLLDPLSLLVVTAVACMTIAALLIRPAATVLDAAPTDARERALTADEIVAASVLLALPAVGYVLAVFVTGAFHQRYVIQGVLGFAILVAWWAAILLRSRRDATILVIVLFLAFGARQGVGALGLVRTASDPLEEHHSLLKAVPGELPVVVPHPVTFLQLAHYSSAYMGTRLTYLTKPADVVQQLGIDTGSRGLRLLAQLVPLNVQDYDAFVRTHDQFYVYDGPRSYLVPKLLSQTAEVRLIREHGDVLLYLVSIAK